jgi:hypothetical protein
MKNTQENALTQELRNINWLLRSSMLAAAVAGSSTAAHAATFDSAAMGSSPTAVTFFSQPMIHALPATSQIAIAMATANAGGGKAVSVGGVNLSTEKQDHGSSADKQSAIAASDGFDIQLRADTLVITPVLNIGLVESERTAAAGDDVSFLGYSNYPAFIQKGEVRVFRASQSPDAEPLAVLPVDAEGVARWRVPNTGSSALFYVYRVYDAAGKFDETAPEELTIVEKALAQVKAAQPVNRPNFGQIDEAARRTIALSGIMATVTGKANPASDLVRVSGQVVPVDQDGKFATQQIIGAASDGMTVTIDRNGKEVKRVSQKFTAPRDDWFVVGQGDLTLGKSYGTGPAAIVSGDSLAQGSYAIGRAAFYAKGVTGGNVRITAALDTGETLVKDLFSNLDRKDPRQLLRRLNSEQYYPTYGDDSTLVEDAPTQGRFYLRVQKDANQLTVGNFVTEINDGELAQLDRGLFGVIGDLNSKATTSFGERKARLTAFASDPGTIPGREEFRGTGGSLYFLKRQDLSIGSERVRIEVRDRETGLVLETRDLHPQQDYDFDPFQGRLTLLKPLASTVATGSVVREGSSTGNVPVLVVRYEYSPPVNSLEGYTVGGRASAWLGETLRLGVTAQRDTVEEAAQTVVGGDLLLRIAAGTYAKAEVAQSEGPGFSQSNSVDGGLSFTDIANPGTAAASQAWRTELAVDFAELRKRTGDLGRASAYYEHYDKGFSSAGRLTPAETERWGLAVAMPIGATAQISGKYDELYSADAGRSKTGVFDLANNFAMLGGTLTAKAGLRYEDRAAGLLYNSVQDGQRTDAALELGYAPREKNWSVHAFGQATVDRAATRSRNNRTGAGIKAQLTERLSLESEVSGGDGGLGADVQLNHRMGDGAESYVGYSLFADRTDTGLDPQNLFTRSNRGTLTLGARQRMSDSLSVYGENRIGIGGIAPSLTRSFGLRFDPTKQLSITGSFENGRIDDATTGLFRRTATSLAVGYTAENVRIGSALEMRKEKGAGRDQTVWLLRNNLSYAVDPDWRIVAQANLARADNESPSVRVAEFTDLVAGLAFRPTNNERFNALVRLEYYEDKGPVGQVTGSGQTQSPKQVSSIISADFNFDLSEHLTLGAKYGYRHGKVSLSRDSDTFVSSNAHLAIIRLDYTVARNWDVLAEARGLWVTEAKDMRLGALGAIYRHLGNNVKIGVGYSWSDFSDDLTDQSYTSHGPFLNLLGKF